MIDPMTPREAMLLAAAHAYGVTVHMGDLPGTLRGKYEASRARIVLRRGMTEGQRVSALAHELVHARRGDDGHQTRAVEAHVDEEAAGLLLGADEYARAERLVGGDPRALAVELEVTPGLVESWQRRAARRIPALRA